MLIEWRQEGSDVVRGRGEPAYPHPVPRGWVELAVWTGITEIPVWAVRDGNHVEIVERTVSYRLITRYMLAPIPYEATIQSEVLRRRVFRDSVWNAKKGLSVPSTKSRWQFLEFNHYAYVDTLKAEVEEYYRQFMESHPCQKI